MDAADPERHSYAGHGGAALAPVHPVIYLILILPFGIFSGYSGITLTYELSHAGVNAAQIATAVGAMDLFPQTWKFLWAPLADTTLTRKTWYVIGAALTAAGILACGAVPASPATLPILGVLVFLASTATTFTSMSAEALIAHHTGAEEKGRAGGWLQAGNLGGAGLGGGAGLWLAHHLSSPLISAAVLALACVLCTLALKWIEEPKRADSPASAGGHSSLRVALARQWASAARVLKDLWSMASSRRGFMALLVVFLPIGTGAASNLWAAVADGWHASADTVALANGTLAGLVSALGCLIGGYFCDRIDRKSAYLLFGVAQALCMVAMAMAPHTATMFVAFTLLYAFLNGFSYAGFSAVALETIGLTSAATGYNVFASLSNMPILYMGLIEGSVYTQLGASAMLYTEAAFAAAAIVVFALASKATSRRVPAASTA